MAQTDVAHHSSYAGTATICVVSVTFYAQLDVRRHCPCHSNYSDCSSCDDVDDADVSDDANDDDSYVAAESLLDEMAAMRHYCFQRLLSMCPLWMW